MPIARVNGVDLYHELTGDGTPLVWSHEVGGDDSMGANVARDFAPELEAGRCVG